MNTFIALALLLLTASPLLGQIILDEVMSRQEQEKTGLNQLNHQQKMALEHWLNENVTLKETQASQAPSLFLSINLNDGQKLQLSDGSIWEIAPGDVPTAAVWITPFAVKIIPSQDPHYPCLIVNIQTGIGVKARRTTPPA